MTFSLYLIERLVTCHDHNTYPLTSQLIPLSSKTDYIGMHAVKTYTNTTVTLVDVPRYAIEYNYFLDSTNYVDFPKNQNITK